jgi:exo-beta-1,3-glucanase (GH17 family)
MKAQFFRIELILTMLLVCIMPACGKAAPESLPAPTLTPSPTLAFTPTATQPPEFPKRLLPREVLTISGPALTGGTSCPELLGGLEGGVVLGIDPTTCQPAQTGEITATLDLYVPYDYANSVLTLKVSWPNEQGRGLRALETGLTAHIRFDQQVVWRKQAVSQNDQEGMVYAARNLPQIVTLVPGKAGAHQIELSLPAGMVWDVGLIEIFASEIPTNILGIAYSPYRECQTPDFSSPQPSQADINDDLLQILHSANAVRTYSATGVSGQIPWLANQVGMPVYAGIWLDGGQEKGLSEDQVEMEAINHILRTSTVQAVIVGNEYHLRHSKDPQAADYLLSRIREFKQANPKIPVATAETDTEVFDWVGDGSPSIRPQFKAILDEVDILLIHIYPFWQGREVSGAAEITAQRYLAIQKLLDETYGGQKRLILGEAGWPSSGMPNANYSYTSAPIIEQVNGFTGNPAAQRRYLVELLGQAKEHNINMFYFDAFDEMWKKEGFGGVGRSWGFDYSDRSAKYDLSSLLIPADLLPDPNVTDVYRSAAQPYYDPSTWLYPVFSEWPVDPFMPQEQAAGYNPFVPALMGDMESLKMFACNTNSHSGDTAMRINYVSGGVSGWSGAFWLYPPGNWGESSQGMPLKDARALSFWARGKTGGEVAEFFIGGVCGPFDGSTPPLCPDSIQPKLSTGNLALEKSWKKYTFDLQNVDLSNVVGGFGISISQIYNPQGAEIDLDEVVYLSTPPDAIEGDVFPKPSGTEFRVYTDYTALDNHYIPSNFMGDGAAGGYLKLDQNWQDRPQSGNTSIKVDYSYGPQGWAGVYWTDPENNWGQRPGGYDLVGVRRLTFWARANTPNMQVEILIGGIGCSQSRMPFPDSVCGKISKKISLDSQWKQYTIDLTGTPRNWNRVLGGFGFSTNQQGTFFLDDIVYEFN